MATAVTAKRIITIMRTDDDALARLRLLQLASPTLPIGAFTYSQGFRAPNLADLAKLTPGFVGADLVCPPARLVLTLFGFRPGCLEPGTWNLEPLHCPHVTCR